MNFIIYKTLILQVKLYTIITIIIIFVDKIIEKLLDIYCKSLDNRMNVQLNTNLAT